MIGNKYRVGKLSRVTLGLRRPLMKDGLNEPSHINVEMRRPSLRKLLL